jgi:hypothetical protein
MLRRTAALVTTGALALGGVALLVPQPASAQQDVTAQVAAPGKGKLLTPAQRQQLRSTGHVTVTRHTPKHGTVTVLVQRGTVTALSATSITLRSKDGYAHSYAITPKTKVREQRQDVKLSDLKAGERAMVVALHTAKGDVARRISCIRAAAGVTA